ncbi:MAG: exodeoxyribonuclease VII small subunit [Bacilli bacterium]|nr:exodeoxyribonuclease VII small subunit [Bacilli bacterium]
MKDKEKSFEESLLELETIVKNLENGNVPLDEAIEKFNEAMKLANACDKKLKSAEELVSKILNNNNELENFKIEE